MRSSRGKGIPAGKEPQAPQAEPFNPRGCLPPGMRGAAHNGPTTLHKPPSGGPSSVTLGDTWWPCLQTAKMADRRPGVEMWSLPRRLDIPCHTSLVSQRIARRLRADCATIARRLRVNKPARPIKPRWLIIVPHSEIQPGQGNPGWKRAPSTPSRAL